MCKTDFDTDVNRYNKYIYVLNFCFFISVVQLNTDTRSVHKRIKVVHFPMQHALYVGRQVTLPRSVQKTHAVCTQMEELAECVDQWNIYARIVQICR